jgi:hypothetical protein
MAGITDAMNLARKGLYKELQSIPPGESWEESFWVRPTGFETRQADQTQTQTQTPVAPPPGSPLLLTLAADGVQIYTCDAKNNAFEWTFTAPDAKLSDKRGHAAGTHSAGPTWKAADGSTVVGEVIAKADAPTASPSAIPWLLLRAKSHTGTASGTLSSVAYIRRIETKGGTAPTAGCDASRVSQQTRVPYTATYEFYGAANPR